MAQRDFCICWALVLATVKIWATCLGKTIWINGVIYQASSNYEPIMYVPYPVGISYFWIHVFSRFLPTAISMTKPGTYVQTKAKTHLSSPAWKGRGTGGRWRQWLKEQKQRFSPRIYGEEGRRLPVLPLAWSFKAQGIDQYTKMFLE